MEKKAKQVLDKWKASMGKKTPSERATHNAQTNFEELFYDMKRYKIEFEEAKETIEEAVAAHMPTMFVIDRVYANMKAEKKTTSSKPEFLANWREEFERAANTAFHTWYEIPLEESEVEIQIKETHKIPDAECLKQRALADSFVSLTEDDIRKLKEDRERRLDESLEDLSIDLG